MKQELKSTQIFEAQGITVSKDGPESTTLVPSSNAAFNVWLETKRGFESKSKKNQEAILGTTRSGDSDYSDDFCGGSPEDVERAASGEFDTAVFLAAREELQAKLANVLDKEAFSARKRSRFLSEHDGDWDQDRRYEREPFQATRQSNDGIARTVDIVVNFCFSCGVRSKEIAQYGAVAWSIVDFLERSGVQVSLTLKFHTDGNYESAYLPDGQTSSRRKILVRLKEAGQYMDTLNLARCFTPWFFRRVMFNLSKMSADCQGANACSSLGYPVASYSKAERGSIDLGNEIVNYGAPQMDKIAEFIRAAVAK